MKKAMMGSFEDGGTIYLDLDQGSISEKIGALMPDETPLFRKPHASRHHGYCILRGMGVHIILLIVAAL